MQKLISIIIPNYNHESFLHKRLETVLEQTYQKIEIIILDDASSDNSLTILNNFKNHPKVKITRVLGVIFALEIKSDTKESYYGTLRNKLYNFFIENGVILRPVGNVVYVLPPYIITNSQLQKVYQTIEDALEII